MHVYFRRSDIGDDMQDRYAGDIGDFGKIGLLKALQAQGLSVGVNWYRVDPIGIEKKADGSFKQKDGRYTIPEKLWVCDETLAEKLTEIAKSDHRSIQALEKESFITGARYYNEYVTVERRDEWHKKALEQFRNTDVVFLDPDNGMIVNSVGRKSSRSIKYIFYEEVADYIEQRHSVLIYNHRRRQKEEEYFHEICSNLEKISGIPENEILKITFPRCSVRDFLALPVSEDHAGKIQNSFVSMEQGIWGQLGVCRIPQ